MYLADMKLLKKDTTDSSTMLKTSMGLATELVCSWKMWQLTSEVTQLMQ